MPAYMEICNDFFDILLRNLLPVSATFLKAFILLLGMNFANGSHFMA